MGITSGMVISEVRKGGLFDQYGVPRGLIITSINGMAVNNIDQIETALGKSSKMINIKGFSPDGGRVELTFPAN